MTTRYRHATRTEQNFEVAERSRQRQLINSLKSSLLVHDMLTLRYSDALKSKCHTSASYNRCI